MAAPIAALAAGAVKRAIARRVAREILGGDRGPLEALTLLALALLAFIVVLLLLILLPVLLLATLFVPGAGAGAGGPAGYPAGSGIPQVYWPVYEAASTYYKVNKYLLASIHKQETDFSRNPTVRSGANSSGAMGPMQFLAGTWRSSKGGLSPITAFRPIAGARRGPYPLDRGALESCHGVPANQGCVYDDFDAIAGAAAYLKMSRADASLDSRGTHAAVCAYIGACSEVDQCTSTKNQYCEVLPRAKEWEKIGAIAPEVDGSTPTGARAIVEKAVEIAQGYGDRVFVVSDYRPGSITTNGHRSDHASNDAGQAARDIAVRGVDAIFGPPSKELDDATVAIGNYFGRAYLPGVAVRADTFEWNGYRIQIIWRTIEWGGHMGHIHIGARML